MAAGGLMFLAKMESVRDFASCAKRPRCRFKTRLRSIHTVRLYPLVYALAPGTRRLTVARRELPCLTQRLESWENFPSRVPRLVNRCGCVRSCARARPCM